MILQNEAVVHKGQEHAAQGQGPHFGGVWRIFDSDYCCSWPKLKWFDGLRQLLPRTSNERDL